MVEAILSPRAHMASLGGPAGAAKESETESATDRASANPVHGSRARESKEMRKSSGLLPLTGGP